MGIPFPSSVVCCLSLDTQCVYVCTHSSKGTDKVWCQGRPMLEAWIVGGLVCKNFCRITFSGPGVIHHNCYMSYGALFYFHKCPTRACVWQVYVCVRCFWESIIGHLFEWQLFSYPCSWCRWCWCFMGLDSKHPRGTRNSIDLMRDLSSTRRTVGHPWYPLVSLHLGKFDNWSRVKVSVCFHLPYNPRKPPNLGSLSLKRDPLKVNLSSHCPHFYLGLNQKLVAGKENCGNLRSKLDVIHFPNISFCFRNMFQLQHFHVST